MRPIVSKNLASQKAIVKQNQKGEKSNVNCKDNEEQRDKEAQSQEIREALNAYLPSQSGENSLQTVKAMPYSNHIENSRAVSDHCGCSFQPNANRPSNIPQQTNEENDCSVPTKNQEIKSSLTGNNGMLKKETSKNKIAQHTVIMKCCPAPSKQFTLCRGNILSIFKDTSILGDVTTVDIAQVEFPNL